MAAPLPNQVAAKFAASLERGLDPGNKNCDEFPHAVVAEGALGLVLAETFLGNEEKGQNMNKKPWP